ncbi:hypothetical protein M0812_20716 [Anaeramoeba flamelloides]|uniref:Uncharacterized protein n=1 Tax=Anaeramoeba flamelloides TaxID=1746091 RepID=A0AAV7YS88_9EUKA|nr:hypothetical protein M0812_20716 [Anaeramoeba flamelloides]
MTTQSTCIQQDKRGKKQAPKDYQKVIELNTSKPFQNQMAKQDMSPYLMPGESTGMHQQQGWKQTSTTGLPENFRVKHFRAFSKEDGTRYVMTLKDNRIFWYAPGQDWEESPSKGLF